jgi:hypothetical protein
MGLIRGIVDLGFGAGGAAGSGFMGLIRGSSGFGVLIGRGAAVLGPRKERWARM